MEDPALQLISEARETIAEAHGCNPAAVSDREVTNYIAELCIKTSAALKELTDAVVKQ